MEILTNKTNKFPAIQNSVVTIGNFDGLHLGHMKIINLIKNISREKAIKSVLVTFNPHPTQVISNPSNRYLITSIDRKIELLKKMNIDFVYIIDFNKEFAKTKGEIFIEKFLYDKFHPTHIVVGYDHFFGNNREGSISLLEKYSRRLNYKTHALEEVKVKNLPVKSKIIRDLIRNGDIIKANNLLGWDYSFYGRVVHGSGLGSKLSFPTANICTNCKFQLLPKNGVYSTALIIKNNKKIYNSICNIGFRPTFNKNNDKKIVEVHILSDEKFNIYNHEVELIFKKHIRDEMKFNNAQELINQIILDKEFCISN